MKETQWKSKSFPIGQISEAPSEQDQSQVIFLKPANEETALKIHQIEGVVMGTHPRFDKLLTVEQQETSKQEQKEVENEEEDEEEKVSVTDKHMLVVKGIKDKSIKKSSKTITIAANKIKTSRSKGRSTFARC